MALKENYIDDILDTSKNTKRKYNMITNADGTVSFEDVTEYSQNGDSFGSADINAITKKVNKSLTGDDVVDNLESTETKLPLSANMGKKLKENKVSKSDIINGTVACSYVNSTTLYGQIPHNLGEQYNCIATPSYVGDNPLNDFTDWSVFTMRHNNLVEFYVKGNGLTSDSGLYVDFLLIKLN